MSSLRVAIHASTGLLALTLGVLTPPLALGAAGLGVLCGWVVFPLTGLDRALRRPGERFVGGLRTYPLGVLALVALLPAPAAAAGWAILAFGDAAAAVVGRRVVAPAVFGHGKATWSGLLAQVLVGAASAWGASVLVSHLAATTGAVPAVPAPGPVVCLGAASAGALADLLLARLGDDNLPIATAAGLVLFLAGG
jgi:dolichol kinase